MTRLLQCVAIFGICMWSSACATRAADLPVESPVLEPVRGLMDAFNSQSPADMGGFVAEDFTWYQIDGDDMAIVARGRDSLENGMVAYFRNLPSARADFEFLESHGAYAFARERSYWTVGGVERSQSAVAVYHVQDGLIRSVWFYPAEK